MMHVRVIIVIVSLIFIISCRNPFDFSPDDDDPLPPPDPPVLIAPVNHKVYYYDGSNPYPNDIQLSWYAVEGVEIYQIQVSGYPDFSGAPTVDVTDCTYIYKVEANGAHYWRVRVYSKKWTWYTEWSASWKFSTYYAP